MKVRALAIVWVGMLGCDEAADGGAADAETQADSTAADVADDVSVPDTATTETAAPDSGLAADSSVAEDSSAVDTAVAPDTSEPAPKLSYQIEPFTVLPGRERQVCKTVNVPADKPFDVVRFESEMLGLSHHFNLYKVIDGTALDPVTAEESTVHDCSPAAEQLRGDAAYIYGSASPNRIMETPPGVAFHLEPGQRLIVEYHAINYTPETIEARLRIDLFGAPPDMVIEHHADIIWFANWGFFLPPGQETSDTTSCSVPYDVEVFGLMSHFHELGTHFTVDALRGGEPERLYESSDWSHPLYLPLAPTLSLNAGESLRWTCTWNNTRDTIVMPNKDSKDEMCMVFASAYPKAGLSAEPIQCNVFF